MKLTITHRTQYRFDRPLRSLVQSLRLWPTEFEGQDVLRWSVDIEGHAADRGAALRDGAGDWIETVALRDVSEAAIVVSGEVETRDLAGVVRGLREKVPPLAYLRASRMTGLSHGLRELSAATVEGIEAPLDRAHALATAIRERVVYTPGTTESWTTAAEALEQGTGVCQDQTHALIAVARAAGMPARYAVGYLHATADGTVHQASHAWAEIWVEGLGWVGFDAANGCCPDEKYVRLGSGLDAVMAAPIRGVARGGAEEIMDVDVSVVESSAAQ